MVHGNRYRVDQGTTQEVDIKLPTGFELSDIAAASISFSQRKRVLAVKRLEDILEDGDRVFVRLTQRETLRFREDEELCVQMHLRDQSGRAMLSDTLKTTVGELFDKEEI